MTDQTTLTELQKRRLALLEETVQTYTSKNRSTKTIHFTVTCIYSPSKTSPGCAIGRKISKKLAKKLDAEYDKTGDSSVKCYKIFKLLPKNLRDLGQDFLVEIQRLHDTSYYWGDTGISDLGESFADEIRGKILNNTY